MASQIVSVTPAADAQGLAPPPQPPKFQISEPGYSIACTQPEYLLRHDISDEELEMLAGDKREAIRNGMWTFLGAAIGALPSGICALFAYIKAYASTGIAPTVVGVDLIQMIVMVAACALAFGAHRATLRDDGDRKPLIDQIRERTRRIAGINPLRGE